jgi:hypothetical protein
LYQRKYPETGSKANDDEQRIPVYKNDIGHVINQIIIWSVIVFLSVFIATKFF